VQLRTFVAAAATELSVAAKERPGTQQGARKMIIKRSGAMKGLTLALGAAILAGGALSATPAEAGKKKVNIIINVGGGPYIGSYGGFGGGCWWLKKKALMTGSAYWWNQYYLCKLYS
jgi:hypothetical protein